MLYSPVARRKFHNVADCGLLSRDEDEEIKGLKTATTRIDRRGITFPGERGKKSFSPPLPLSCFYKYSRGSKSSFFFFLLGENESGASRVAALVVVPKVEEEGSLAF